MIIGNKLLQAAFSISFEVHRAGGVCAIECPDWPHWINEPATIWRTRAALTLFELDGITVTSFNQCVMGALGKNNEVDALLIATTPRTSSEVGQVSAL